jgi:protein-tyrosine sulfotransferase
MNASTINERRPAGRTVWAEDEYVSTASPIFVGGAPRSGTTLLSVMLNAHPALVCGPEADLLRRWRDVGRMPTGRARWAWHRLRGWTQHYEHLTRQFGMSLHELRRIRMASRSGAEFIDRFFDDYAKRHGVRRWVEKSPANVKCLPYLFERFPRAKFVHIIRDGRDVAVSLRRWSVQISRREASGIGECIGLWADWVRLGREWSHHPNYTEIRYEELVSKPEETIKPLFDRLELDWDPVVLEYADHKPTNRPELAEAHLVGTREPPYTTSVARWREALSDGDRATVERIAGPLLGELGYTTSADWVNG